MFNWSILISLRVLVLSLRTSLVCPLTMEYIYCASAARRVKAADGPGETEGTAAWSRNRPGSGAEHVGYTVPKGIYCPTIPCCGRLPSAHREYSSVNKILRWSPLGLKNTVILAPFLFGGRPRKT